MRSQWKCENKISAQSSQIRDLCSKLDSAITKNSQMQEFLNPSTLQTVVSNVLHTAQSSSLGRIVTNLVLGKASLSWVSPGNLSFQLGRTGTTDPKKTCRYCKVMGHDLDNCLCLQCKKECPGLSTVRGRVKLEGSCFWGSQGRSKG